MDNNSLIKYAYNFTSTRTGNSLIINADCLDWLECLPANSIHAVVTDPPYGIKEFNPDQLEKRKNGNGGIWRIPPNFDGNIRSPLPRFTALNHKDLENIRSFFSFWAKLISRVLRPGGHIFIASNSYLSQLLFSSIVSESLEFRGEIIRLVKTFRGGDRPKNAEKEFVEVCSLPRGSYEPWGLFRKTIPKGMKVSDCLHKYQTGGLRRYPDGKPFRDVIESTRTPGQEKTITNHPSTKPQDFMRQIVYASLPLGKGIVLDPFMGSGSTIAAAEALGYSAIGIEINPTYYQSSIQAIPELKQIQTNFSQLVQLPLDFNESQ